MGIDALNDLNRRARARGAELRGRRVLGPEIDGEIADSSFGHSGRFNLPHRDLARSIEVCPSCPPTP